MAATGLQNVKNSIVTLGQRKIRTGSLLMVLSISFSLLVIVWAISAFLLRDNVLPTTTISEPNAAGLYYQYAMLGEDENRLSKPMGVAVAGNRVYATDTLNKQVQVFSLAGDSLFSFGSGGSDPGMFDFPYGIVVTPNEEIFVADTYNGNISVFDSNGAFLRYFALDEPELKEPSGMVLDEQTLYVCDLNPGHVLVFDLESGELLRKIGSPGTGMGQLDVPNDLAIHPDNGNIYVSDTGNSRIQIFTETGEFVETMDIHPDLINSPRGISFGSKGELYVISKMLGEVVMFDKTGNVAARFGEENFQLPNGLTFDNRGRLYVTDHVSVVVFD